MGKRFTLSEGRPVRWRTGASLLGLVLLLALAAAIGVLGYRELRELRSAKEDASWAIYQLGLEHQRLLLSLERNDSEAEIRLRGDIYLSRVSLVRDGPLLAEVRQSINGGNLERLFSSAHETEHLLADAGQGSWREPLLRQVRADAPAVRELTLEMTSANRRLQAEQRNAHTQALLLYLAGLELLLLALLALGIALSRAARKLRGAGRELAGQLATQTAILRSVDDAILGLAHSGRVLYSNPRALELLGKAAARGSLLLSGGQGPALADHVRALLASGDQQGGNGLTGQRKVQLTTPEGPRHYVLRKFRPAGVPPDGEGTALIVSIADVSIEEEAAQRREEYDARLTEASRLLAFAAISGGIVHEISQPLAAIRNYIFALKVSLDMPGGKEEHRILARHLGEEVDRAIEVVRNVRRMGPQEPQEEGNCDIGEAIAHAIRLVSLGSNPPPPISVRLTEGRILVQGSLPLIGQVIVNLLKNALSASAAAGHAGAEVSVARQGGNAEISVADFGEGVSEEVARSLFAPFSKSARGGMGLGLAICQRIAATLGGSLSWENRDRAGAVFRFTIPLAGETRPA